jgi:hypothetical protein
MPRRRKAKLGAIVEEHLEYRVPAKVEAWVFGEEATTRGAVAFCMPDGDEYLKQLESKARFSVLPAPKKKLVDKFIGTAMKEMASLRASGITGKIPVCILPSRTGPVTLPEGIPESQFDLNERHERFHARFRRAEARNGMLDLPADEYRSKTIKLQREFASDYTPLAEQAINVATEFSWARPGSYRDAEEVLARLEEVDESCVAEVEKAACKLKRGRLSKVVAKFNKQYGDDYGETYPTDLFDRLRAKIDADHGSAIDYAEKLVERVSGKKVPKAKFPRPARGVQTKVVFEDW